MSVKIIRRYNFITNPSSGKTYADFRYNYLLKNGVYNIWKDFYTDNYFKLLMLK